MSRILNPAIFKSGRTKLIEALQKERKWRKEADRGRKRAEGDLRVLRAKMAALRESLDALRKALPD